MSQNMTELDKLHRKIRNCKVCVENPLKLALPHAPNPVVVVSSQAKIAICGQAPGNKVNISGVPFTDPSGVRLREWLNVDEAQFYDRSKFAIIPMGFCFPGYDKNGGDLPPRKECVKNWHAELFRQMDQIKLLVLIGSYAQKYHLGKSVGSSLTETVTNWRDYLERKDNAPIVIPLPHPSWRNTGWIKKNPWFESDLLPVLREKVHRLLV